MVQYLDKNTMQTVESPVRFDLRMVEYRHLTLLTAPTFPLEKKSGFTMRDIAASWGVSAEYLQHNRKRLLPSPDGKISGSLVWGKVPERKVNPPQTTKVPEKLVVKIGW